LCVLAYLNCKIDERQDYDDGANEFT